LLDVTPVKVLIVDDEPAVRAALERALRATYDVRTAADGHSALEALSVRPVDAGEY